MVGTLRFAHPTGMTDKRSPGDEPRRVGRRLRRPGRHYHNLSAYRGQSSRHSRAWKIFRRSSARSCPTAIWWHDVVYDATRADNEELSARLAEQHVREDLRQEVGRLIRLTKTHDVQPDDRLGAILISIDLSILARGACAIRRLCRGDPAGVHPCAGARLSRRPRQKCSASSRPGRSFFPMRPLPPDMTGRPARTSRANWLRCVDGAAAAAGDAPRRPRLPHLEKIPLADLDPVVAQNAVRGGGVEIEIRKRKIDEILLALSTSWWCPRRPGRSPRACRRRRTAPA